MDALNRRRNTLVAGAALVLFATVYYSLIYRYGLNLADEGNVALISQRLLHGERPFLNVSLGYNVLWFYPISTLFRLFGTNLLLMRTYFYGISTASGLIAFMLLRRLDAPLWLAFAQGLAVISVTGQYFKAYIPFLVISNLFAITLVLDEPTKGSSKRRRRASARDHLSDPHRRRDISNRDLVRRHFAARGSAGSPAPLEFDCCGQFLPRRCSHAPSLYLRCLSSAFLAAVRPPILECRGPHLETYTTAPNPNSCGKPRPVRGRTWRCHGVIENHSVRSTDPRLFFAVHSNKYF